MRLTAPLAVRGGKNSSENQLSPDSIRRRILSRSLSVRSVSNTGVELRELSLELSPPLLLAPLESLLHDCHSPSTLWTWFTMFREVSIYYLKSQRKATRMSFALKSVTHTLEITLIDLRCTQLHCAQQKLMGVPPVKMSVPAQPFCRQLIRF